MVSCLFCLHCNGGPYLSAVAAYRETPRVPRAEAVKAYLLVVCIKVPVSPGLGTTEQMSEPSLTCHSTQMVLVTGCGHWDKNESAEYLLGGPLERGSSAGQREELSSAVSMTSPRSTREQKPGWSVTVSCLGAGGVFFILPMAELGLKIRRLSRHADG